MWVYHNGGWKSGRVKGHDEQDYRDQHLINCKHVGDRISNF